MSAPPTYEDLERKVRALEQDLVRYRVMQTALSSTSTLMAIMDLDSTFLWVNEAHPAILGYEPEEIVGVRGFGLLHPDDVTGLIPLLAKYVQALQHVDAKAIAAGQPAPTTETVSYRCRHKNGEWRWLESVGTIIDNKIYCFSRDRTERRKLEEKQATMQARLEHAARLTSLGTLSAGIAHELNNPLTAVIGFAEMILTDSQDARAVAARAERIKAAATRMQTIVEQILSFSSKTPSRERRLLDINRTIRDSLLILERMLETQGIALTLDQADDLPLVAGDPHQLQSVFHNLLVNAVEAFDSQHTTRKWIRIATSRHEGSGVRIVFQDNAEGMTPDVARHAFEPFFTTKEVGHGTGLGLSVTHGIVRDHGGSIALTSTPGQGTRFEITLPAVDQAPATAPG
jgi:PAS domain S-box-containing protein